MARYHINHLTTYKYAWPVYSSQHIAHLQPVSNLQQTLIDFSLHVSPQPEDVSVRQDFFGNTLHQFSQNIMHEALITRATSQIEVHEKNYCHPSDTMTVSEVRSYLSNHKDLVSNQAFYYTFPSSRTNAHNLFKEYSKESLRLNRPLLEGVLELNAKIHHEFAFDNAATSVDTKVMEFYLKKRGVCQDFTHFMIACLRSHGLPAKYVSGYILTHPKPGQPRLEGADASHAWLSVYLPQYGWVDVDPTNNMLCRDEHITVAYGRDYDDVCPLKGVLHGGGQNQVLIEVTVTPIPEEENAFPLQLS